MNYDCWNILSQGILQSSLGSLSENLENEIFVIKWNLLDSETPRMQRLPTNSLRDEISESVKDFDKPLSFFETEGLFLQLSGKSTDQREVKRTWKMEKIFSETVKK